MKRFPPDGAEQFVIGSMAAQCAACRCEWFLRKMVTPGLRSDVFVCARCRAETSRATLVSQIGNESVRQAQDTRARSRGSGRKPPEDTGTT